MTSLHEFEAAPEGMLASAQPLRFDVPIRTAPGQNAREAFYVKAKRVKAERHAVAWVLAGKTPPETPCTVLLTRIAPSSGLDDDNLSGALKAVRDQVAVWIGVDDRHSAQVRYVYSQARGPWGVRIQFGAPSSGAQYELGLPKVEPPLPF